MTNHRPLCSVLALLLASCGGAVEGDDVDASFATTSADLRRPPAASPGPHRLEHTWWRTERRARQRAIDAYLDEYSEEFSSFKNAPLGSSGVPVVLFRLFAEVMPDVWGPPSDNMLTVGFTKDSFEPDRVFPLGIGYSGSPGAIPTPAGLVHLQVASITCAACHLGRVETRRGDLLPNVGAPNTQFNQYRGAIGKTVTHPLYTAHNFRAALNAKPLGWLYGDEAMLTQEVLERAIFNAPGAAENMLQALRDGVIAGGTRFAQTIGEHTYHAPGAPDPAGSQPGYLDAIAFGLMLTTDPALLSPEQLAAVLPPAPAEVDLMSVWQQEDRPAAQWDGSIADAHYRNLAAEVAVVGDPTAVNLDNVDKTTRFTAALPPAPYPFDVDSKRAARGRRLYARYCSSCHEPGSDHIFPADEVGTDANRANIWTPYTVAGLTALLRIACTDPSGCQNADGTPIPDERIVQSTGGYMAVPLAGIWARAPYLHNGSVPTLHALLTGDRPQSFVRGNVTYDQDKVGFTWDQPSETSAPYDTSLSGHANTGHDTLAFNGIRWKKHPEQLRELLEYLKTL
jgi:hypothetical protein